MLFKLAGRHRIKRLGPFTFKIDRPKGYVKTWGSKSFTYPCDYGYFPGVKGEDGEALDAFVGDDLSGRMESFLKLKKDQSGNLVPDETKFLVGVSEKDAKKIYALYGDEASQRVTYESVDDLKAAVKEFKPMKKKRYESAEGKGAAMEEATPTKLAATQALERFGIKAASAKTADLYKKLLGEIMARKRGKTTEKTATDEKPPGKVIPFKRPETPYVRPTHVMGPFEQAAWDKHLAAERASRLKVMLPFDAGVGPANSAENNWLDDPANSAKFDAWLASVTKPTPKRADPPTIGADELAALEARIGRRHVAANDLPGVVLALLGDAAAPTAHSATSLGDAVPPSAPKMEGPGQPLPPPTFKPEVVSNPAGPQSMYARFRKLPRLAQGAIVTPAALLSAYGLYRGGKALVNRFSPEKEEEEPTKLGAAELAYKLAPSLANAYDAYQATSAALEAQKQQEERMRFPALHATQPERMMNAMYSMDPSSTGSFDSPPVHHRRHRHHH